MFLLSNNSFMKAFGCFICCICIFFQSCLNLKEENGFIEEVHLKGKSWNISDQLGAVYDIRLGQDYLFLRNKLDETMLSAINLKDKSKIFHFGQRGEGPEELINPGPLMVSKNTIKVYDAGVRSLKQFVLDENNGAVKVEKLLQSKLTGIISMAELSDSKFLLSGIFSEGRFCVLDKNGDISQFVGSYPVESQNQNLPFHVSGMAYQSMICSQPNGSKIAFVTRYAGIMQICDWNQQDSSLVEIASRQLFLPMFTTRDVNGTPNFRPSKDTRWGYLSVSASSKYVFCLYSGRLQQPEEKFNSSKEVHVFDWNGNAIYRLILCSEALSISVTDETLLVLVEDQQNGYDILEYQLLM